MDVYITWHPEKLSAAVRKSSKVLSPGSFQIDDYLSELGSTKDTIYLDDLAVMSQTSEKASEWDKGWEIIDLLVSHGNKVVFIQEGIELVNQDDPAYLALQGVAAAICKIRKQRNEKCKGKVLAKIADGANPSNWKLHDEELIKVLVNKREELGVDEACREVGISKQTYYRWKKKQLF